MGGGGRWGARVVVGRVGKGGKGSEKAGLGCRDGGDRRGREK